MTSRAHKIMQLTKVAADKIYLGQTTQSTHISEGKLNLDLNNNSDTEFDNVATTRKESIITHSCGSENKSYEGNDVYYSGFTDEDIMSARIIVVNTDNSVIDDTIVGTYDFTDSIGPIDLEDFELDDHSNITNSPNNQQEMNSSDIYKLNSEEVDTTSCRIQIVGENNILDLDVDQDSVAHHDDTDTIKQSRKRKAESGTEDGKKEWKRGKTKICRMAGSSYVGYRRKDNKVTHDAHRAARSQGQTCTSKKCHVSSNIFCESFSEEQRKNIFKRFWECSWEEKQTYVVNMVSRVNKKRQTVDKDESRRNFTLVYHLKYKHEERKQVCKKMFLGTLGLNEWMVNNWVKKSEHGLATKEKEETKKSGLRHEGTKAQKKYLENWIEKLPKMESHYCRKDTQRLYLEGPFNSKKEILDLYNEECINDDVVPLKRSSFFKVIKKKNISLFMPRKDQCDLCTSYKANQVAGSEEEYNSHLKQKTRAREEKEANKKNAKEGERFLFTMDLQSVNLCPRTNASAMYYSMKLKVYNFTIFNLGNSQCSTYWWYESEGNLEASVFASILLKHLKKYCVSDPESNSDSYSKPQSIIIFSDGCGYQNRNSILANALLNFSVKHNVTIEQKYLTKGHTQMECDSAHALIERRLKNKDIYLPSDYLKIAKEARKDDPYETVLLDHTQFFNYADKRFHVYSSIRPGKTSRDPEVKDVRALKYDPQKRVILYKVDFDEPCRELLQRPKNANFAKQSDYTRLYSSPLPLTLSKFNDLQSLKKVLPVDTHSFYDALPCASQFVQKKEKCLSVLCSLSKSHSS